LDPCVCDGEDLYDVQEDASVADSLHDINIETEIERELSASVSISVSKGTKKALRNKTILLDSCAGVSIFNDKALFDSLMEVEPIRIDGVSLASRPVYSNIAGTTEFGVVYYSPEVSGNILSLGDVVDNAKVSYDDLLDEFVVCMRGDSFSYTFTRDRRKENIYVHTIGRNYLVGVLTTQETKSRYTTREIRDADRAREYIRRMNYITAGELARLLAEGKIRDATITAKDVVRAIDIYGKDLGNLKGKTTARRPPVVKAQDEEYLKGVVQREQALYMDLMYVQGMMYLITVAQPSDFVAVTKLSGKSKGLLNEALKRRLAQFERAGFTVTHIRCDGESGIETEWLRSRIGVAIDTTGDEAVGQIERKIRTVKERLRAVICTLPFKITDQLLDWLSQAVVYSINSMPTSTSTDRRSPREKVYGKMISASKDLKYGFGDYVQVGRQSTDNSMRERTIGALALMPTGNDEGSWWFLSLNTWKAIKGNRGIMLPMTDEVIAHINERCKKNKKMDEFTYENMKIGRWKSTGFAEVTYDELPEAHDAELHHAMELLGNQYIVPGVAEEDTEIGPPEGREDETTADEDTALPEETADDYIAADYTIDNDTETDVPDEEPSAGATTEEEKATTEEEKAPGENPRGVQFDETPEYIAAETEPQQEQVPETLPEATARYNLRSNRAQPGSWAVPAWKKRMRAMVSKVRERDGRIESCLKMSIRQGIEKLGATAVKSVVKEMMQLHTTNTFLPLNVKDMNEQEIKSIIPSSMFLKEKFTAEGAFDKLKARLVAGGHQQDRSVYDQGSSPTVATAAILLVATMAAKEHRAVATVDFPGAFLHSEMPENRPVFMRLNKVESSILVRIDPKYQEFMKRNGTMIVKLRRALYGCVESARLWYDKLSRDLESIGFAKNGMDQCVFNRTEPCGKQTTLAIHVDDVLVAARDEDTIDKLMAELKTMYSDLTIHRGRRLDYIGMTFDFNTAGRVRISMDGYVSDFLDSVKHIEGTSRTPAAANLFSIKDDAELLDMKQKEWYHSVTAKLLYLGKRVRPDILTAVSFLAKRVQQPTVQDLWKLERLIKYIRGTALLGIILQCDNHIAVYAWIDASYAVHDDLRSHTGTVIGIGRGPVHAKSTSQHLNVKSSFEAELVGLSDSSGQVIWIRNFLLEQGYKIGPAKIYQDNMGTIAAMKNGKSNSDRTKHIAIRYYFVADRVKSGEVDIEYCPTEDMLADILTKPLQGSQFVRMRNLLLNDVVMQIEYPV
jgi:Reverse transcriptase (RNA-dependent DNA polymerase)